MVNVAALKKKAADFELKKQFDKAIATYQEILAAYDAGAEDSPDVGLYNRVGDLLVRIGNVPEAVTMYERAVDLYESGGFFNNAIALCNKILRTSPGRAVVYYKLGRISAAKGFKGEAKQNFLEYAERMRNVGDTTESFRALKEFVELWKKEHGGLVPDRGPDFRKRFVRGQPEGLGDGLRRTAFRSERPVEEFSRCRTAMSACEIALLLDRRDDRVGSSLVADSRDFDGRFVEPRHGLDPGTERLDATESPIQRQTTDVDADAHGLTRTDSQAP